MRSYKNIREVVGPLLIVDDVQGVAYDEMVEIYVEGERRIGQVLEIDGDAAVIQLFESSMGIRPDETRVHFMGKPMTLHVSEHMVGRMFDG